MKVGPGQLPAPPTKFFGRARDLEAIDASFAGVQSVVDPCIIEFDQDWDLFHHSDPTHSDFSEQYIDNYGNFLPNWTPPCN